MVRKNVAEILLNHVTLETESIDRMYLNGYVPTLQTGAGLAFFLKNQLGCRVPSTCMLAPMTNKFVGAIKQFVEDHDVDLHTFSRGERKDDIAQKYRAEFEEDEGVVFVGKAQGACSCVRLSCTLALLVSR